MGVANTLRALLGCGKLLKLQLMLCRAVSLAFIVRSIKLQELLGGGGEERLEGE